MTTIQEIVALIDRSGSMHGKEYDTIAGINESIDEIKKNKLANEEIFFSVKMFNNKSYIKLRSLNIKDIRHLKPSDLKPDGTTALYDSIGDTLMFFINKKICFPNSFSSCIIYIATDGYENASTKYTSFNIKNMIEEAKKYSINILYLAANQDAILEASKFGLDSGCAINYSETSQNIKAVYRSAANAAKRVRSGDKIDFTQFERQTSSK